MAQNKVQYQRSLPMLEFFKLYGSQDRCDVRFRRARWAPFGRLRFLVDLDVV